MKKSKYSLDDMRIGDTTRWSVSRDVTISFRTFMARRDEYEIGGMYFAVTYASPDIILFTRVGSSIDACVQLKPKFKQKDHSNMNLGQLAVGQQLEIDVTFNSSEAALIDEHARLYGLIEGKGISVFTSERPYNGRVITVRRIS